MRLLGREKLDCIKTSNQQLQSWLKSWASEVLAAHWKEPLQVKAQFPRSHDRGNGVFVFPVEKSNFEIYLRVAFPQEIALIEDLKSENGIH